MRLPNVIKSKLIVKVLADNESGVVVAKTGQNVLFTTGVRQV